MSRRHASKQTKILPDAKYGNTDITKLMNCVMFDGKKSNAEKIVYGALDGLKSLLKKDPLEAFEDALGNLLPTVEVKSRRIGGATYQVPIEVSKLRAKALAIRWLVLSARKRSERTMIEKLSKELFDASNSRGAAFKKKEDTHKMAEANKAFAHYRL